MPIEIFVFILHPVVILGHVDRGCISLWPCSNSIKHNSSSNQITKYQIPNTKTITTLQYLLRSFHDYTVFQVVNYLAPTFKLVV